MRDGFVFYRSFLNAIEMLDIEEARLEAYEAIIIYAIKGNEIPMKYTGSKVIFEMAKPQIDANNKRSENAKKGGRPSNKTNGLEEEKPTDKETENHRITNNKTIGYDKTKPKEKEKDKEKDKEKENIKEKAKLVLDYLNKKTGKAFKYTNTSLEHIEARLKDGYSVNECKRVIDIKCAKWMHDIRFRDYLRPQTLFRPSNFESYLNETVSTEYMVSKHPVSVPVSQNEIDEVSSMIEKLKS